MIKTAYKFLANFKYYLLNCSSGFTLIEVLVATTILATLVGGVLLSLNPIGQINKGRDAQRQADLQSIKTGLDLYYNDNKCYPTALPFGQEWRVNNTVYMKKVPQDPQCNEDGTGTCYRYRTDSGAANNCPQWNVVFAQLSRNSTLANACPLSSLSNCTPAGYSNGQYACVLSGGVNCDLLASASIIGGSLESVSPTATPTLPPSPTPTPTPTPDPNDVVIPLPQETNPDPYEVTLNPAFPIPGATQTIKVKMEDPGVKIESVEVVVTSDGGHQANIMLNPPVGVTNNAGTWSAIRQVGNQETFYNLYAFEFYAVKGTGQSKVVGYETIALRGTGL